jgi:septal ring factor EnvC (AmiA/AmiB activator)
LNPRPPGYEPGELPDCSTPRRGRKDSITFVPWWTWLCLGIFLLALLAAAVFAVYAFRRMKRISGGIEVIQTRLDEVSRLAEEVQRKQARNQENLEKLQRHRAQTEASIARLQVLTSALSEALGRPRRARARYLRKNA